MSTGVQPGRGFPGPASSGSGSALARGIAWLPVLAVGIVLFELVRHSLIRTQNPNLLPALILLGAAVIPAAFVTFLYGRPLVYEVPSGMLALTALVGGVVGIVVAGSLEYRTLVRLGTLPMLSVGLAEEAAKLVVPALLLLFHRYRHPANGLVIGVASGAGFAALETMGYAFVTLVQTGGNLAAVDGVLLLRGLLSPAAHMAWTGLTAAALWHAAYRRWDARGLLGFAGAYVVAVLLHTNWDSIHTLVGYAVLAAISLGLLIFVTHYLAVEDRDQLHPRGRPNLWPSTS